MLIRAVLCALLCALSACSGSDNSPPSASNSPTSTQPPPTATGDLTIFAAAQGLNGTIIDAGPDQAQNIWAATSDALYVLRPGESAFRRFTASDGLHVQTFTDPATGQATASNITAMAGGQANEVFVGYRGYEGTIPPPAPPPLL